MIAVIYARVSTSTGKQDTDRQVKELTEFAKEYNIEIAKVFQDYRLEQPQTQKDDSCRNV